MNEDILHKLVEKGYTEQESLSMIIDYNIGLDALKKGLEPSVGEWKSIKIIRKLNKLNNK